MLDTPHEGLHFLHPPLLGRERFPLGLQLRALSLDHELLGLQLGLQYKLQGRVCIRRTTGVMPKHHLGPERTMETNLIYASAGGIRTFPHLLESRDTA